MAMLEASDQSVVKSAQRKQYALASSDEHYMVNPGGEVYESSDRDRKRIGWPKHHDGGVVKCVTEWIELLSVHDYRVLFLRRDPAVIKDSWERFNNRSMAINPQLIGAHVEEAIRRLRNRRDVRDVIEVDSDDLVYRTNHTLTGLIDRGWPFDMSAAGLVRYEYARTG